MTAVDSKTFDILDPGMPVQFCLECDCINSHRKKNKNEWMNECVSKTTKLWYYIIY